MGQMWNPEIRRQQYWVDRQHDSSNHVTTQTPWNLRAAT